LKDIEMEFAPRCQGCRHGSSATTRDFSTFPSKPAAAPLAHVKGFKQIEVDVIAPMNGLTLFQCHQQLHMDYGLELLFKVV
jgi:hypothetical protein